MKMMMMRVTECVCFLCILLCVGVHQASSATVYKIKVHEKNLATLPCGDLTRGEVTWSRDRDGKKEDLLTLYNGNVTKHVTNQESRYSLGKNLFLSIFRTSQSDTGKYHCNGTVVELTVIPRERLKPNTEDQSEDQTDHITRRSDVQKVLVCIMAVSFAVAVASVIALSIYITKRKGEKKIEQLYTKVNKPKKIKK